MNLFDSMDLLLHEWCSAFSQQRTFDRIHRLSYGLLLCPRRHLTSTAICAMGRQFEDWSADYRVFSRSHWDPHDLFNPVIDHAVTLLPPSPAPVMAAMDDTLCKKSGRHIPGVSTARDPQSLPFHVNLIRGYRFVQASLLISPLDCAGPARALPVRFQPAPPAIKPKKTAPPEAREEYKKQKKALSLTQVGLSTLIELRQALDQRSDTQIRQLLMSVDGSYTNQTLLKKLPPRTTLIGRIRQDADLHLPLNPNSKTKGRPRKYGPKAPTPKEVLRDESIPTHEISCFAAGKSQTVKVKVFDRPLYWSKAGHNKPLLLVVIKPLGYRPRKGSKLLYREPAFLICTDPKLDLQTLVQTYVYRWEIEINHRDEKSFIGVAQGQVRNPNAVPRLPQLQVAAYSLLLLASILTYGFQRTADYLPLPKWRRKSIRPSILDLLHLLLYQILGRLCDGAGPAKTFDHFPAIPLMHTKSQKALTGNVQPIPVAA
jgi:hypothetical protein